jgi:hypothetical protein
VKWLVATLRMVTEKGVVCAEILKSEIKFYQIPDPWPPKSLSFTPLVPLFHSPCLGFNPDVPLFHPPGSLRDMQSLQYSTEGACLFGTFSPQAIKACTTNGSRRCQHHETPYRCAHVCASLQTLFLLDLHAVPTIIQELDRRNFFGPLLL